MSKKKETKLPVFLTVDEINKLFSIIPVPRDLFLFRMIYFLGLRINEALKSNAGDYNVKEKVFTVRAEISKNGLERRIPIPLPFLPFVKSYLGNIGEHAALFDIKACMAWRLVKKYVLMSGIKKSCGCHTLRHSYATFLYSRTKDIKLVQTCLGHKNIQSTSIYMHLDDTDKRDGVDRAFSQN